MVAPDRSLLSSSNGYHPLLADLTAILGHHDFDELLIFGTSFPDVMDAVRSVRLVHAPPASLPQGVYWFSGVSPRCVLAVGNGSPATASAQEPFDLLQGDGPLSSAFGWYEHVWEDAHQVTVPQYGLHDAVFMRDRGQEAIVRERTYVSGRWKYAVFAENQRQWKDEESLGPKPAEDDARSWVAGPPVSPDRFAATMTRAKLENGFTDTIYSFRATRTLFRPYQFRPVMKILNTGTLGLLIADEVGLGKTIEAGLVWTELEARREANRVLVVCPSSLVAKWGREMEERFGFDLKELTSDELAILLDKLESGTVPRRISYVCSIERLRMWEELERATDLGLQFDLAIVDEAHAFRNAETKSFELGEQIAEWSEKLLMLSATPVNLRNRDLLNLLSLLVPGEFDDLESLEERLEPNRVLNKVTESLLDRDASNADRRAWLRDLGGDAFGRILMKRPEFRLLQEVLSADDLTPNDAVRVKRLCAELHGLSAEVTRTRKVEVDDGKAIRELDNRLVEFDQSEADFYQAYLAWCVARAKAKASPLYFAMQMPLRLAGSCLPKAAEAVLAWGSKSDLIAEDGDDEEVVLADDCAPGPELVALAHSLARDTKFDILRGALADLLDQQKQGILFTFSRRTLEYLESRLDGSYRIATLHGGKNVRERNSLMAQFRAGEFDFVIATKVASEGLDFEFCSVVINYDIPWNPMEIEQRIGRIDRIGQAEDKIVVLNFHTPGTIETDILERVLLRIGIFERSIGALEPIIDEEWTSFEQVLFDFSLSDEQRQQKQDEAALALEEQALAREEVETAAPVLLSSDGADIDGLEHDLLASGRYVGQDELAILIADWAGIFGGRVERVGKVLRLRGSEEMATHVQALVTSGERLGYEVADVAAQLRADQWLILSLDQEYSRESGVPLLTANHVLTRAALKTPGYRLGRFTALRFGAADSELRPGNYLCLLSVVTWSGIRPLHEVWASTVAVDTLRDAGTAVGEAVMAALARGELQPTEPHASNALAAAVDAATFIVLAQSDVREQQLRAENDAFLETRRLSFQQGHERRLAKHRKILQSHQANGKERAVFLTKKKIEREYSRYESQLAELASDAYPSIGVRDMAVCLVEVVE